MNDEIAEVLCIPRGSTEEVARFTVYASDLVSSFDTQEDWTNLSLELGRYKHRHGVLWQPEIFLCLDDEFIVSYQSDLLRRLLHTARHHVWAAPLYLVINQGIENYPEAIDRAVRINEWFKQVIQEGVTEIIQADLSRRGSAQSLATLLEQEAERVRQRHRILQESLSRTSAEVWRCTFLLKQMGNSKMLAPLIALSSLSESRQVLVFSQNTPYQRMRLKSEIEALKLSQQGKHLIAQLAKDLPQNLKQLCGEAGFPVLSINGLWELRFVWHYLNNHHPPRDFSTKHLDPVSPDEDPIFKRYSPQRRPSLLITNAFSPNPKTEDDLDYLAAKEDVGQIIRELPRSTWRHVDQAASCQRLQDLFASRTAVEEADHLKHLTAWLHLGHGNNAEGLREYTGQYQSADDWLRSFGGREGGLALAFFSACCSLEVARRFAQAGTGVTIGFGGKVKPVTCRILSTEVISVALWSHGDRHAILHAFRLACQKLSLVDLQTAAPMAFSS